MNIRTVLQILLQGISLKPKRRLMAKLVLPQGWRHGGWPTLYLGGGGWRNAYHKKVKKSLNFETTQKTIQRFFKYSFVDIFKSIIYPYNHAQKTVLLAKYNLYTIMLRSK